MPPFAESQRAIIDGVELAYRRAGDGRPVLLLHGIPTSSRLWDEVGDRLAGRFDVIAPDLLGYGESGKPADRDVSMAAQPALMRGLLEQFAAGPAIVVGHDLGGAVAQLMAVDMPELVDGLVLIDSVSFDSWPILRMRMLRAGAPPFARRWPERWFRFFARLMRPNVRTEEGRAALDDSIAVWGRDRASAEAFIRNARAMDPAITQGVAPRLREIRVPTHVVWGRSDPFQRVKWASKLRDAIPDATLTVLDGGHFLPWDAPGEVTEEIHALAARAGGQTP